MDLSTLTPLLTSAPGGAAYEDMDACSICNRWTCRCVVRAAFAAARAVRTAVSR